MERLIIFDFDGTLTDTGLGITRSAQYALDQMGWPHREAEELRFFVGPPLNTGFAQTGMNEEESIRAIRLFRERYESVGKLEYTVYPGIGELLCSLKERGWQIGMATSKPEKFAREISDSCGFLKYFDCVSGIPMAAEERILSKAELIRRVLEKTGFCGKREAACMVGDRKYDIEGARAESLLAVGAAYGYGGRRELEDAGADVVFDTVDEMSEALLENKVL
ncbi:MAG: HAD hydrolase-like protein [Bilifractor sp.]|jgi:phosphoglycolate phosphatase